MQRNIKPMDIWMVSLTDTLGTEQRGQRPAIIIAIHSQANVCMVVPLTSNLDASKFSHTHKIECTSDNELSVDSVALVFQMRTLTISAGRFLSKVGMIEQNHFDNVKALIKDYLQIV